MSTTRWKGQSYEIRVSCGYDINGKKIVKYRTWKPEPGMTKRQEEKELQRQAVLFEEQVRKGVCPDNSITFKALADRWMEEYAKVQLAPKTVGRYAEYLKRINQAIGHIKLKDLRPFHLNAFYKNLSEPGINQHFKRDENGNPIGDRCLAPKTIMDHHRVISKILNTAIKWELLDRNAADGANPPKVHSQEVEYLNEEQAKKLILLLSEEPIQYRTMIILLIYTGLRRGELCGLEWQDIDVEARSMRVVRSSQYIGNGEVITKEPKTRAGVRKLTLSHTACRLLQEYRQWQEERKEELGDRWVENGRLFTQWDGKPIHPQTISGWFAKFLKKHEGELPKVRLHSLRHSNATLLIAEGTDICTVSQRLGHAQTSTTLNVYAHALKSKDADAADRLDAALSNDKSIVPFPARVS